MRTRIRQSPHQAPWIRSSPRSPRRALSTIYTSVSMSCLDGLPPTRSSLRPRRTGFRPSCRRPSPSIRAARLPNPTPPMDASMIHPSPHRLADWWIDRLRRLTAAGVSGFGCRDPHLVPAPIWQHVIDGVRDRLSSLPVSRLDTRPDVDADRRVTCKSGSMGLFPPSPGGMVVHRGSSKSTNCLRGIGAVIGSPEAPFGPTAGAQAAEPRPAAHNVSAHVDTRCRHRRGLTRPDGI